VFASRRSFFSVFFLLAAEGLNVLMNVTVDAGLYTGFGIGSQGTISISHLQFVDYNLVVGNKSWANVRSLKVVLMLFEALSGLKINYHKSMLVGVNVDDS